MRDRSVKVRLFIKGELSQGLHIALSSDQAKYLFKVMRLNVGQQISIFDGKSGEYYAQIIEKSARLGKICVGKKKKSVVIPPDLWLLFSPLKKNRTEWIVEKATELGVRKMVPLVTSRTVTKDIRITRLNSIIIEALEQCGGTFLPKLLEPVSIHDFIQLWKSDRQLIFCDETLSATGNESNFSLLRKDKAAAILIGPEGGFSEEEGQLIKKIKNAVPVSLGPRILRADTAAVSAISIWQSIKARS